jgi:murein DD-endopeptidase MepM/ murein hydrolase activator NlpD
VLALAVAVLVAPFAGSTGFAAPPQRVDAPATTVPAARGSLRPRGAEAAAMPSPTPTKPTPEPEADPKQTPAPRSKSTKDKPDRVWPLKQGSFTFTQPFGCVHQIANFYSSAPGCPADRPVFHTGIDLSAPLGTTIYAAASGWVTHAGPDRDSGLANSQIIIQHEGVNRDYGTEYLHWQAAYVKEGDYVRAGQPIAEVGSVGYSTGPHLHFSVIDYRTDERIDPMSWLPNDRSAGGYLGLSPDAKRFPIAAKSAPQPDYADPAPPPPPKRERVPNHDAKKAAKAAGKQGDGGSRANKDKSAGANSGSGKHKRRHDGRTANADVTPTSGGSAGSGKDRSDRGGRSRGNRDRNADATATADNGKDGKGNGGNKGDKGGRDRSGDGDIAPPAEPTATLTPQPTGPGTNLPPPVPPVPGVPAPLLPGATAPQPAPTAAPTVGKSREKHKKQKKQKRQKKADASET